METYSGISKFVTFQDTIRILHLLIFLKGVSNINAGFGPVNTYTVIESVFRNFVVSRTDAVKNLHACIFACNMLPTCIGLNSHLDQCILGFNDLPNSNQIHCNSFIKKCKWRHLYKDEQSVSMTLLE